MSEIKDVRAPAPRKNEDVAIDKTLPDNVQYKLKLIATQLDEAGGAIGRTTVETTVERETAYNKLHSSWRLLMDLRGKAFLDGFDILIAVATKHRTGIFDPMFVNRYLVEGFPDSAEREVFVIFMNMVIRYVNTKDKSRFTELNSVSRLTSRISDPELVGLIHHAFGEN